MHIVVLGMVALFGALAAWRSPGIANWGKRRMTPLSQVVVSTTSIGVVSLALLAGPIRDNDLLTVGSDIEGAVASGMLLVAVGAAGMWAMWLLALLDTGRVRRVAAAALVIAAGISVAIVAVMTVLIVEIVQPVTAVGG